MQYYECRCGKSTAFSSMHVPACVECSYCHTKLLPIGLKHSILMDDGNWFPSSHQWRRQYESTTGKPYDVCADCNKKREVE